jgi:hypothetical protein
MQLETRGHVGCTPPGLEKEPRRVGGGQLESDRFPGEGCQRSSGGPCEAKEEWGMTGIPGRGDEVSSEPRARSSQASKLREHAPDVLLAQVHRQSLADEDAGFIENDTAFGKDLIERACGEVSCDE